MKELDQAIQIAGGVGALANDLGVPSEHSISMWKKRGNVPTAWAKLIAIYLENNAVLRTPAQDKAVAHA